MARVSRIGYGGFHLQTARVRELMVHVHDRAGMTWPNQSPILIVHIPRGALVVPAPTVSTIRRVATWPS